MKPSPELTRLKHELEIDAALAILARVEPRPGIESRVSAAVAQAQLATQRAPFLWLRPAGIGVLVAGVACGIVIGTVEHSNRTAPLPQAVHSSPAQGISAAQTTRVPTHATTSAHELKPGITTHRVHSRAEIQPNSGRRPSGAAVPRSPYPPGTAQPQTQDAEEQ